MDLSKPEYQVMVDRTRAADLGLSVVDVANTIRSLVSGAVATKYREGDYFYNIRVMIPEKHFASRQDIENVVSNHYFGQIPVKQKANTVRDGSARGKPKERAPSTFVAAAITLSRPVCCQF